MSESGEVSSETTLVECFVRDIPSKIQDWSIYEKEARLRDCWHVRFKSSPNKAATCILNSSPESIKAFGPFCGKCTLCFVRPYFQSRSKDRILSALGFEILSDPFQPSYLLSKFMYRHTDLWRWCLHDIMGSFQRYHDDKSEDSWLTLHHWMMSFVRHFPLLRGHHFRFFVNDTKLVHALCRVILVDEHEGMFATWIICYILTKCQRKSTECVDKLKVALRARAHGIDRVFVSLLVQHRRIAGIVHHVLLGMLKRRRSEEQCQSGKCEKTRDLMICSECLVTSYCSRKCAKYDWKYGHHKHFCNSFAKLKREAVPLDYFKFVESIYRIGTV